MTFTDPSRTLYGVRGLKSIQYFPWVDPSVVALCMECVD
ncbi:hypothetical protein PAXY110619_14530 [Paenibacillus xylanexedens]